MVNGWFDIVSEWVAIALLNGVWGGTLLVALLWCGVHVVSKFRHINASTRYTVWVTGLACCVVLMVWQGIRSIPQELNPLSLVVSEKGGSPLAQHVPPDTAGYVFDYEIHIAMPPATYQIDRKELQLEEEGDITVVESTTQNGRLEGLRNLLSESHAFFIDEPPSPLFQAMFVLWGFLTSVFLSRLLLSALLVFRLKKEVSSISSTIEEVTGYWLRKTRCKRQVEIGVSHGVKSAVAVGYMHPMVLIPERMLVALERDEIEQVVVHELAHIHRFDDWAILFQQLVKALLFFHPGVLVLNRLMNQDREIACDDWVVSLTRKPKTYAACLAKVASINIPGYAPLAVASATSSKKQLFIRVKSILDRKLTDSHRISRVVFASMLVAALGVLGLIAYMAPTVAFAEKTTELSKSDWEEVAPMEPVLTSPEIPLSDTGLMRGDSDMSIQDTETFKAELSMGVDESEAVLADIRPVAPAALQPMSENERVSVPVLAEITMVGNSVEDVHPKQAPSVKNDTSLSSVSMIRWLDAVRRVSSPAEQKRLLVKASYQLPPNRKVQVAYIHAASTIASPSEKVESLVNLLIRSDLDTESALLFLEAVRSLPTSKDRFVLYSSFLVQDEKALIADERIKQAMKNGIESIRANMHYQAISSTFLQVERELENNN